MPIVGNGQDVHIEYNIPDEIKSRIPQYFYSAFAGELCSVFGCTVFEKNEPGFYSLVYISGTAGWSEALKMTCRKLDVEWLFDYYDSLPWYDSDMFGGEIEDMVISECIETDEKPKSAEAYYGFLLKNNCLEKKLEQSP